MHAEFFHVGTLKHFAGNRVFLGDLQGGLGDVGRCAYIAGKIAKRSRERDTFGNRLALAQGIFG